MDPNAPQNNPAAPNQPTAQPQPVADPQVVPGQAPVQPQPVVQQPPQPQPVAAPPQPVQVQPNVVSQPQQPAVGVQPPSPGVVAPAQQYAAPVAGQPMMPQQPPAQVPPVGGPSAAPAGMRQPPNKVLKIATIVVTIIAICLCSYGALHVFQVRKNKYGFAADADKARKEQIKKAVENSKPETEKRTDGKLNLTKLFDTEYSQHNQDIKAGLNEQVNLADGFSYMVTGVEGNWQKTGDYETPPAPGKEYIKVSVVIGSRAEKGTLSFYTSKLELENTKGGKQQSVGTDSDDLPNNGLGDGYGNVNLNPGDQRSGWIIYEVDKGESPLKLVYEQKGYACRSNDNKDCLMKGAVTIQ